MSTNPDNKTNPPSSNPIGSKAPPQQTPEEAARAQAALLKKQRKDAIRKRKEEAKKLKEDRKKERKKDGLGERRDLDYETIEIVDQVLKKENDCTGQKREFRPVIADLVKAGKAVADFRMQTLEDCGLQVTYAVALADAVTAIAFLEAKRNQWFALTKMMLPFSAIIQLLEEKKWEEALKNPAIFFQKEEK
jgi:hypothetical protein